MSEEAYAWPRFTGAQDREAPGARAREEATARGYAEGLARAENETRAQREALARALAELPRQVESVGEAQARTVTELALEVARKLLIAELRTNPAVLEALVLEALQSLEVSVEQVRVLVNPADHEALRTAFEHHQATVPELNPRPDPSVPVGGVSVQLGAKSVEFDPLGRLESFVEQEMTDGAASVPPDGSEPAI